MRRNGQVDPRMLPEPSAAVERFESFGGHLTLFSTFGEDPLQDREEMTWSVKEKLIFLTWYPDFGPYFYRVVNVDYTLFHSGLLFLFSVGEFVVTPVTYRHLLLEPRGTQITCNY